MGGEILIRQFIALVMATMIMAVTFSACTPGNKSKGSVGAPYGLMTELLANPELTVITDLKPEFSWIVNDTDQDEIQKAYQILVASSLDNLNKDVGEPAFAKMQIKPQIGDLTYADLTLPTIRGDVKVEVKKTSSLYTIKINIPANTKAKVYVRKYNNNGTTVKVNGVNKKGTEEGEFIVFDNVGSGTHTFERVIK